MQSAMICGQAALLRRHGEDRAAEPSIREPGVAGAEK
jgi:hypothetical protein